jgi:hypothetical protein
VIQEHGGGTFYQWLAPSDISHGRYIPNDIALNSISVLPAGYQRDTVAHLTEIAESMATHFELGLVVWSVAVSRALNETKLRSVGSVWRVDIHW